MVLVYTYAISYLAITVTGHYKLTFAIGSLHVYMALHIMKLHNFSERFFFFSFFFFQENM